MKKIWFILVLGFLLSSASLAQDRNYVVNSALDMLEETQDQPDLGRTSGSVFNAAEPAPPLGSDIEIITIPGDSAKEYPQKIIERIESLDVRETPLDDVLDIISSKTGIVFIIPDLITQKVSLFVEDISVWDLLKILLQHYGLAYHRTDGAVHIMSKDIFADRYGYEFPLPYPTKMMKVRYADLESLITLLKVEISSEGYLWVDTKNHQVLMIDSVKHLRRLERMIRDQDQKTVTKTIVLQHRVYDELAQELSGMLTQDIGRIQADDSKRELKITDTEEQIARIEAFLKKADTPVVYNFWVKIVRINLNEEHLQGIDWEAIISDLQSYSLKSVNGEEAEDEAFKFGTLTSEDYDVLLEALDTVGEVNQMISFKDKIALNREHAIDIETNDPFWALRPGAKQGKNGPVILDPDGFEMKVNIVLQRDGENFVMKFLPRLHWMEKDSDPDIIFAGEDFSTISFSDSEVVVIGGLLREEEISRTRKVPLLGDLPMVGTVFRRQRTNFKNTEYIVFLKPAAENAGAD